jgi:transposase
MQPPFDPSKLDPAAKDALILTLLERIEALTKRVEELEARLAAPPKTPDNSSTPPSRGEKASPGAGSPKGKGKAHKGSARALHPAPTRTLEARAPACPHCAADVSEAVQTPALRYDRIEIPEVVPDVTRVVLFGGRCPCCKKRFRAPAPEGLEPGSPWGPNLRAHAIYLHTAHAVSFERLRGLFSDLYGLSISEGALVSIMAEAGKPFAEAALAIRARLLEGGCIESDETSVRVGKKTSWLWTFHHGDSACFRIAPSRGKDVVEDFLGQHRPDYWVSDRLSSQMGWARKEHQVCLAHLIRDAQYGVDAGDRIFAPKLKELLVHACGIARRRGALKDATLAGHARKLDDRLDKLLRLAPSAHEGKKLQRAILGCRAHLFVFLANRDVPSTNNGSERALRPCATFRKVTNCFRAAWGAKLYADVRSVLETARRRAVAALQAIRLALRGDPIPLAG